MNGTSDMYIDYIYPSLPMTYSAAACSWSICGWIRVNPAANIAGLFCVIWARAFCRAISERE